MGGHGAARSDAAIGLAMQVLAQRISDRSTRALAEKAGVTQATLVALERGKSTPRLITMEKIAAALGVEASRGVRIERA